MKIVKSALIVILALIMVFSSLIIVAAETNAQDDKGTMVVVTISDANGGTREYELVWKFKYENGHYYKRRWNYTLGEWYDPYWILVY